ncbi:MAG: extensin family protein [Pseudomonadota bacterium]
MTVRAILAAGLAFLLTACGGDEAEESAAPGVAQICGDPRLAGNRVAPIGDGGGDGGCGIAAPVAVTGVMGLTMEGRATLNCTTARALADWVETGLIPADRLTRSRVTGFRVAASYACRGRNHQPGARLSEHAFGNAIDISEFSFADGSVRDVRSGWNDVRQDDWFRRIHRAACGPFGTVLGPESDRFHQDHFHFDVARYRSGPYCR